MFSRSKRLLSVAVLGLAAVTLTAVPAHAVNEPGVVVSGAVTEGTPLCELRRWVPLLGNLQPLDEICP
ncbi:hypothetical protein E1295_12225 [Nonomuraea mesophila]|uniref:Secreted protein n=1 Tax=Nonomuraea mesophila TaxID=2530382 RepID=A0A4R5FT54_9ACTN|nr:hypothetical protein [Nonomuraea mesophila]TDE56013.1 hypothetical protein E1295_12225 [Nonomuraea mesophila]